MVCSVSFFNINQVKKDKAAIAILLDINYHGKRASSDIIKDINLPEEEVRATLEELDRQLFIKPNPHRNVIDINYVLAEKGEFLINGLKAKNPDLFRELESMKLLKLSEFIKTP